MPTMSRLAKFAALALSLAPVSLTNPALAEEVDQNRLPPSQDPTRVANGLAQTPPMGWNSWNKFACNISEKTIRDTADALVATGMKDAGYNYLVIDDCWHGERDAKGFITANAKAFPSGIKALADYVHSKGLKFGIYSDAGTKTCGGRPGSQGHEYQDAITYASWGVDYLKYDWCSTGSRNAEEAYALMSDALRSTGRDVLLSLCEWGTNRPWLWASKIGNMWRSTADITDKWSGKHGYALGMLDIVDLNEPLWPYAAPGHWNDPDMLEVGNGGMTSDEYRTHMTLWAMSAAPLMMGHGLRETSAETLAMLTNKRVIAVDQDAKGVQGKAVRKAGSMEIWAKPLADGRVTLALFNRGDAAASLAMTPADAGLAAISQVEDLWSGAKSAKLSASYTVPARGAVMLVVGS